MASQRLLLLVLLVLALSGAMVSACNKMWNGICFTYAPNDDVFWGVDCDFSGRDIGTFRGGADKCGGVCKGMRDCARWSWNNYQGGTCYFKGQSNWDLTSAKGVNCGFRYPPRN